MTTDKAPLTYAMAAAAGARKVTPPPGYIENQPISGYGNGSFTPTYHPHEVQAQQPSVVVMQPSGDGTSNPPRIGRNGVPLDDWQVGLCQGCSNCGNCFLSCFCPCILACKAASKLDENPVFPMLCGTYPLSVRFRTLVGIRQDMCTEAALFCFCPQ